MKIRFKSAAGDVLLAWCSGSPLLGCDSVEKKGWGANDLRQALQRGIGKIKAKVVKVMEVVPMPGMCGSDGSARGNSTSSCTLPVVCKPGHRRETRDAVTSEDPGRRSTERSVLCVKVKKGNQEFKVRLTKDGPFWT